MNPITVTIRAMDYPPQRKHAIILETFRNLKPNEALLLINDHDPLPLRYQLEAEEPGTFTWEYVERGPEIFRVRIGRVDHREDN
jgi:uncharacterized protein (DUF2249 family)